MKSKILAAKKTALAVALATGITTITFAPAQAGIPVIDGGNLTQNIMTAIESVAQTLKQIEQYQTQLQQYENQLQNTMAPAAYIWDQAQTTMDRLIAAIVLNELTISIAKLGPLMSSHQKKPVNIVKRTNSAKNSPMSALRKAIMPNVQTIEITTRVQNNQDAYCVIVPAQVELAVKNRSDTSFRTPPFSIAAKAD